MIRISRLTDYGIVLLCYIAREPEGTFTASELAERSRLPLPTVAKILKSLCRGGLLRSHRGVHGGYALAKSADDVSIADVLEALEGPFALTDCSVECACDIERTCPVRANWRRINGVVLEALERLKLSEMLQPLPPRQRREARLYRLARRG
jgi:FeS assembly SUF system regulator